MATKPDVTLIKDRQVAQAFVDNFTGTTTTDSADAGYIGEYSTASVAVADKVNLTSTTAVDVTSISLTAGDWDVWGNVLFLGAASTSITILKAGINTTTATLPTAPAAGGYSEYVTAAMVPNTSGAPALNVRRRISVAATTTVYLVTNTTFSVSTLGAYGSIEARRVR